MVLNVLEGGSLPVGMGEILITLIPKVPVPEFVSIQTNQFMQCGFHAYF